MLVLRSRASKADAPFPITYQMLWLLMVTCSAGLAQPPVVVAASPLSWTRDDTAVTVAHEHVPLFRYRYGQVPFKPYADRLATPAGANVLRDAPPDHAHHHGLMFAVAVEGIDFWAEFPEQSPGVQRQRQLDLRAASQAGVDAVQLSQRLDWTNANGEVLMTEQREITIFDPETLPASLMTWQSTLATADGRPQVTLSGSHYFGLGMRFVESMDRDAHFTYDGGQPGELVRGEERVTRGRWCALHASATEGPVTVALFDHPSNPRSPATFFTMPTAFAYLSATLNLWREPLVLTAEKPLTLRYGIAVWDGTASTEQVEQSYRRWLGLSGVDVPE
jgi:hypothetical protein